MAAPLPSRPQPTARRAIRIWDLNLLLLAALTQQTLRRRGDELSTRQQSAERMTLCSARRKAFIELKRRPAFT